jgi:hydroxymethylpyrimidine pyrophosphatase-like HAD family hydrolase
MPLVPTALSQLPPTVAGSVSRPDYIEVVPQGTSKWSALCRLYEEAGIDPAATAAVGDGSNDLEMIASAGIGIAMGHAPASLREAADWTVPTNAAEGFAAAVRGLLGKE